MEWIWAPAVGLLAVFVAVLFWLFFKDYTCCPCRRKRPPSSDDSDDSDDGDHFIARAPDTILDMEEPPVQPGWPYTYPTQPNLPSSPSSVIIDVHRLPHAPRTHPKPPPHPPRTMGHVSPASTLIPYNFGDNVRASKVVRLQSGIPTLDLHQMKVREAVRVTESFLKQSRGHCRKVRIITGRGLHSVDGIPKIKPAVEFLLEGRNYRTMAKGGCFEVTL